VRVCQDHQIPRSGVRRFGTLSFYGDASGWDLIRYGNNGLPNPSRKTDGKRRRGVARVGDDGGCKGPR
jgi:hypothetical protein